MIGPEDRFILSHLAQYQLPKIVLVEAGEHLLWSDSPHVFANFMQGIGERTAREEKALRIFREELIDNGSFLASMLCKAVKEEARFDIRFSPGRSRPRKSFTDHPGFKEVLADPSDLSGKLLKTAASYSKDAVLPLLVGLFGEAYHFRGVNYSIDVSVPGYHFPIQQSPSAPAKPFRGLGFMVAKNGRIGDVVPDKVAKAFANHRGVALDSRGREIFELNSQTYYSIDGGVFTTTNERDSLETWVTKAVNPLFDVLRSHQGQIFSYAELCSLFNKHSPNSPYLWLKSIDEIKIEKGFQRQMREQFPEFDVNSHSRPPFYLLAYQEPTETFQRERRITFAANPKIVFGLIRRSPDQFHVDLADLYIRPVEK
ncbi:hypothetical protein HYU13_00995 [Candidatus Woesearchaeota archaeon]|nr:hypothetical protein [Candidatus Woesearchaeota archaeon]